MVRCPHCGYEFVESGKFTDMLLRWIRRGPPPVTPAADSIVPVTSIPIGTSAPVSRISSTSAARLNRLASYGIVPGTEIRLIATRPTVAVSCGSAFIALEENVAREIFVKA